MANPIQKVIPKFNTSKIVSFFTSENFVVALTAVVATPLVIRSAESAISKIPFLKDHFTFAFLLLGFIVSLLASMVPSGMIRAIVLGVGVGLAITAVVPFFEEQLTRLRGR